RRSDRRVPGTALAGGDVEVVAERLVVVEVALAGTVVRLGDAVLVNGGPVDQVELVDVELDVGGGAGRGDVEAGEVDPDLVVRVEGVDEGLDVDADVLLEERDVERLVAGGAAAAVVGDGDDDVAARGVLGVAGVGRIGGVADAA